MKKSFSIFELLLVLAAIAILFTITIPRLSFFSHFLLQGEVEKLFSTFNYLQQKAIASNSEQELFFDLAKNYYFYKSKDDSQRLIEQKLPQQIKFGFLPNSMGPPSSPSKSISSSITFKYVNENQFRATFLGNGSISPGTLYLVDIKKNHMMALSCSISQVSCIRKYRYTSGKWICLK
jgi:type II secretory pathway pseudopilin PulG